MKNYSIIFPFHASYCQVTTMDPDFLLLMIPAGKGKMEGFSPSVELLKISDFVFNIKGSSKQKKKKHIVNQSCYSICVMVI